MELTAVDLSSYVGLVALALLTLNILLGLLLSTRYNPAKRFPYRRINIFKIHNWTGYSALSVALLHPALLLLSATAGFRLFDLVFPVWSPVQPLYNTLGAIGLYALAFVVVTSYYRVRLGARLWKRLHFTAYAAAAFFFVHSFFTDPHLRNTPPDPFDAEKVFVELCILLVVLASVWRVRYALRHPKGRKAVTANITGYETK